LSALHGAPAGGAARPAHPRRARDRAPDRRIAVARKVIEHDVIADEAEVPFERVRDREAPQRIIGERPRRCEVRRLERRLVLERVRELAPEHRRGIARVEVLAIDRDVGVELRARRRLCGRRPRRSGQGEDGEQAP
jgi:hypothetical protein